MRPRDDPPAREFSPSPREAGEGGGGVRVCRRARPVCGSAAAHANGAFPDSQNILTPADRPQEIMLVTNFGARHLGGQRQDLALVVRAGRQHARHALPADAVAAEPAVRRSPTRTLGVLRRRQLRLAGRRAARSPGSRSPTPTWIRSAARACWRSASPARSTACSSRPTAGRRSRRRCTRPDRPEP